jgi:hypothetical protein
VAVVAERLCEQMALTPTEMLAYLKTRGCRVGGVTLGESGLLWYDETGAIQSLHALSVPTPVLLIRAVPATFSTAPTFFPTLLVPIRAGMNTSVSPVPRLHTRSNTWGMKQDCLPSPTLKQHGVNSKIGPSPIRTIWNQRVMPVQEM